MAPRFSRCLGLRWSSVTPKVKRLIWLAVLEFEEHGPSLYLALVEGGGVVHGRFNHGGLVGKQRVGNTKRESREGEDKCQSPVLTHSRDNSSRLVRTS